MLAQSRWLNALGFQAGWWGAVAGAGAGRGMEAAGLLLCLVLALAHLRFSLQPRRELQLAALSVVTGIVIDTSLQEAGIITFHGVSLGPLSPLWLWTLWMLFAFTLNASMAILRDTHWAWSAGAGFLFGPASYLAGGRLGAARFDETAVHLALIGLAWAIALPWLTWLARSSGDGTRDAARHARQVP